MAGDEMASEPSAKLWASRYGSPMRQDFLMFIEEKAVQFETQAAELAEKFPKGYGDQRFVDERARLHAEIFDEGFYIAVKDFVGRVFVGEDTRSAVLRWLDKIQFRPEETVAFDPKTGLVEVADLSFTNPRARSMFASLVASESASLRRSEFDPISKVGHSLGMYTSAGDKEANIERPKRY